MTTTYLTDDIAKVERKLQDLLLDGHVIDFDDCNFQTRFRFAKRGQLFKDGDYTVDPLETGIFQKFDGTDERPHWVNVGHVDTIDQSIMPHIAKMESYQREAWYVGLLGGIALRKSAPKTIR